MQTELTVGPKFNFTLVAAQEIWGYTCSYCGQCGCIVPTLIPGYKINLRLMVLQYTSHLNCYRQMFTVFWRKLEFVQSLSA